MRKGTGSLGIFCFLDDIGCVPFYRDTTSEKLLDSVRLDPKYLADLSRLGGEYALFAEKGVRIFVSFAAIDIDQVPEDQRSNVDMMGELFISRFSEMDGVTVFGSIRDFLFHDADFYDTVYHLLSDPARECTRAWIDGLSPLLP